MLHEGLLRKRMVLIGAAVICMAAAAVVFWRLHAATTQALPERIVQAAGFPVLYPTPLPPHFRLDPDSVQGDDRIVSYKLTDKTASQTIVITEQAIPAGFTASSIIGSNPIPTTITKRGSLYDLSVSGSTKYMLTSDRVLVFMLSADRVPAATIQDIAQSLTAL